MADMGSMMGLGGEADVADGVPEAVPSEPMDEESSAAVEAFPELAGAPERIEALKTFVRLCVEKHAGGGYDEEDPKPKADLLLAFGEPKSKKK